MEPDHGGAIDQGRKHGLTSYVIVRGFLLALMIDCHCIFHIEPQALCGDLLTLCNDN